MPARFPLAVFCAVAALLVLAPGRVAAQSGEITPVPGGAFEVLEGDEADAASFSPAEESEIGRIVRDYLLDNPEVIVEVLQVIQQRRQQAEREQHQANLVSAQDGIFDEARDPFVGNPDASVTVVEFFDYHCPFCKRMANGIALLTEQDDDVKVVFKEFPVFGPESVFAARAALASRKQGLYGEFHLALMRNRGRLNESIVMRLADRIGLDTDRLRTDMQAPEIEETIRSNLQLAQRLGIRGTPSFIIGNELVPGALDIGTMRRIIQAKRQS